MAQKLLRQAILKVLDQTGKKANYKRDVSRQALPAGKRISRTGNIYWETRKNRSDKLGKRV